MENEFLQKLRLIINGKEKNDMSTKLWEVHTNAIPIF